MHGELAHDYLPRHWDAANHRKVARGNNTKDVRCVFNPTSCREKHP
jgi:hypothetical protein